MLEPMTNGPWKNGACLGYAIKAMENLNYSKEDIQAFVAEMKWLFDIKAVDEADNHFRNSPY